MGNIKSVDYSGQIKNNTKWLASEDIMQYGDDGIMLTIEGTYQELGAEFENSLKQDVGFLKFNEAKKFLIINSTNRRRLVERWGNKVKDWKGKKIIIFAEKLKRKAFGIKSYGIRIKFPPDSEQAQLVQEPPNNPEPEN